MLPPVSCAAVKATRLLLPMAVCSASPAAVAGSNSITCPASQVTTDSDGPLLISATSGPGPPDGTADHTQVGVAVAQ